jgi:hypothetical protein
MLPILPKPFIQLPYQFDVKRLQKEIEPMLKQQWLAHPQGFVGNQALPLVSVGGQYNHDFAISGQMLPTSILSQCTYIREILCQLNIPISRTRLMRLEAGAEVHRHYDASYHWYRRLRLHIPIFTHPGVVFGCSDEQQYMRAGEVWCFDHRQWHWVKNSSPYPRVHLVIDTKGSDDLFSLLAQGWQAKEFLGSDQSRSKLLRLEPYLYEVLRPEELFIILEPFTQHFSEHNAPELLIRLDRFKLNWVSVFKEYGHSVDGEQKYRELINEFKFIVMELELNEAEKAAFITIVTMLSATNGSATFVDL